MSLPAVQSFSALSNVGCHDLSFRSFVVAKKSENGFVASTSSNDTVTMPLAGVVFHPFKEVKKHELAVPISPDVSIARQKFSQDCESTIN